MYAASIMHRCVTSVIPLTSLNLRHIADSVKICPLAFKFKKHKGSLISRELQHRLLVASVDKRKLSKVVLAESKLNRMVSKLKEKGKKF